MIDSVRNNKFRIFVTVALYEKIFVTRPHVSDIFISYASADRSRVMPLVDELQRRGWSVWWDRTIRPGKTWDQVIEAALTEARCVIVLWSRDSVQSDWVRTEADDARQRGILVPALIDDVAIPLAFRRMQAANLVQWSRALPSAEFDRLIQAINEVLSDGVPSPTLRPGPVPIATRRRNVWTFGLPSRAMAAIGATLLVCVAGPAWYFARSPQSLAARASVAPTISGSSPVPAKPRNNPRDDLNYVFIPAGKFLMGCSPDDTECDSDEKPPHAEQIADGFWLGQTEVTQAAWKKVNGGADPSYFKGDQLPVETVAWDQAVAYCKAVGGRLPTEKEWEYAARGGTTNSRYGDLDAIAWYSANSGRKTHPTGFKQANAFGLYDMLGNVWEWTSDSFDAGHKSVRGGSWLNLSSLVRASFRIRNERPAGSNIGFRCVWELR